MVPKPHFLLFCDGHNPKSAMEVHGGSVGSSRGQWRFILEDLDAGTRLEVSDAEMMQAPERAALLAVVRGLEALEQPSRVTLVTTSRYVARGLQFGLIEWREADYCWEHFGSVQPIRNDDLWRRVDHAMQYHQINCRWVAGEVSEEGAEASKIASEPLLADALQAQGAEKVRPTSLDRRNKRIRTDKSNNQDPSDRSEREVTVLGERLRRLGGKLRDLCRAQGLEVGNLGWGSASRRSFGV
jgi:ribonuclease HI